MASSFTVNLADLNKILTQIKIAEQNAGNQDLNPGAVHAAGIDLVTIIGQDAAILPQGLRTVSGVFNHLLPGQSTVGAADQPFPRLLPQEIRTGTAAGVDFNGDGIPDFFGAAANAGAVYGPAGTVVDSQPRTISNLIVDQSIQNPAAVEAWFNNPLTAAAFELAHPGLTPVRPGVTPGPTQLVITNTDLSLIPNQSPDIGLSPQFNGFMTFFGQFFDHGLDLVPKGGNGNVFIPLLPDDPLFVPGSPTNFMVISRLLPNAINITTPFVDQNQTYTSHASHQVFLREYVMDAGVPITTGHLLGGTDGGLPKWADVKAQAQSMLGIQLVDMDIHTVPLLATDEYGRFIRGAHGFVQIVTATGLVEANPADNGGHGTLIPANAVPAGTAFLDDIAHNANIKVGFIADADNTVGTSLGPIAAGTYDNELLDQHFITGDGRGNENIGLTTVHTVFHNEHDRLVENYKGTILATGDLALINQWLDPRHQLAALPAAGAALTWNGERLFQAGRFVTEMQYQHLVFEEFARKVQPNVDAFVFTNSATLDPSIVAEFAHTVYRFGHSMLDDTVDRLDNDLTLVDGTTSQIGLIQAFLNPVAFSMNNNGNAGLTASQITAGGVDAAVAGGAILRGMTRQAGNEIDEFVVNALRNNLVGLPLDLAAINMARGRDAGIPTLNHARTELYAMTSDAQLKPYTSWFDFAQNIKHPESIINFIAAYGTHPLVTAETTIDGKRTAAMHIVFGAPGDTPANTADFKDFLNGTGIYAADGAGPHDDSLGGLNNVDLWVGGLAEELMQFGGMLGSTFGAVFEYQMEHLQNGDRFYYLSRTQGMNLLNQLEPSTFADLVMRNTDLGDVHSTHISGHAFGTADLILELDPAVAQNNVGLGAADPVWASTFQQQFDPKVVHINGTTDINGDGQLDGNVLKFSGGEHVVLGGTEGNDTLIGDKGIDTLWGDGGDDYLNAGMESDQVFGGEGDDIIEDPFGNNFLRGNQGNDVISSGHGLSLLFGDTGQDAILATTDTVDVTAGEGNDFVLGGSAADVLSGNEGDDWIEGGEGFDNISGENSELFFNSPIVGHDILNGQGNDTDYDGENGDDIMVQGAGIQRNNGMQGFDWAIHKGDAVAADSDLTILVGAPVTPAFILRDRFDSVEGLSGWKMDDKLTGASKLIVAGSGFDSSLNQAGVDRIHGLGAVIGTVGDANPLNDPNAIILSSARAFAGGEILLGGAGSDVIRGNLGDDIIDGDAWLNVKIDVHSTKINPVTGKFDTLGDHVLFSVDSLTEIQVRLLSRGADHINPGQLEAVREIINDSKLADGVTNAQDIAVFADARANYTITNNANGTITVSHTGFVRSATLLNSDGIDTLRNIEVLRFADGDIVVGGGGTGVVNSPATGLALLSDTSPTETVALTVNTSAIADANGLPSPLALTFQWQAAPDTGGGVPGAWAPIAGATAASFTPAQAQVGQLLRAVVSFTDSLGNPESIITDASTRIVGDSIRNGGGGATLTGTIGDDIFDARGGADTVNALAGDDVISGGTGNDIINAGADNDTVIWNAGDGRDVIDGGTESLPGIGDTFTINGDATAENYRVYARADWLAVAGNTTAQLNAGTEIVVTRNGTNNASVIAELKDIEEIIVNTGAGANTVSAIGNFNPTSLAFNTITINAGAGNDAIDITKLTSAHHVVLNTGGGTDTFTGKRSQDVMNVTSVNTAGGSVVGGNSGAIFTLSQSDLAGLKNLVSGTPSPENEIPVGVRDPSGHNNNLAHPEYGAADEAFIRLTSAHYGAPDANGNRAINPIFAELDARHISNILGAQEVDLPKNAAGANIFFMAFGQYFDHGLDFLDKGGNGTIAIGGPGVSAATDNPADLTRGKVVGFDANGVPILINKTSPFVDQNQAYGSNILVEQFLREGDGHGGLTAHLLAGAPDPTAPQFNLLPTFREAILHHWANNTLFHMPDGSTVAFQTYFAGLVVNGAVTETAVSGLTSNFMGSGQNLLIDSNPYISALDHYLAGDGRANENVSLTAMHTIWARNHNFQVENLKNSGFDGTQEEVFQAARMVNEAEYQRVVFTEFADSLIGGIKGTGDHGFKDYHPETDSRISHEFAAAVYRVGHSLIADTLTVMGADGQPMQVKLLDAFLNPTNATLVGNPHLPPGYVPQPGYAQLGVGNILGGIATQQAEEVDFNIVDAVRNDLVRIRADLFAFNVARSWDVGLGTMNQVRADLKASSDSYIHEAVGYAGDLSPYVSWADFQQRNGLSNAVIAQFKEAYPDLVLDTPAKITDFKAANPDIALINGNTVKGIDRVDLWVGGLAEKHINGGQVGQTFWVVLQEQFDRLQEGDRFYYLNRMENFDIYKNTIEEQGLSAIIGRNTGLTNLPDDIFHTASAQHGDNGANGGSVDNGGGTFDHGGGTGGGTVDHGGGTGGGTGDHTGDAGGTGHTGGTGNTGGGTGTGTPPATPTPLTLIGDATDNLLVGQGGDDVALGNAGNDMLTTANGNDALFGGAGDDTLFAGSGDDMVYGEEGNDRIFAGDGNDMIKGGGGEDIAMGGAGNDTFITAPNDGNDSYYGDAGIDTLDMSSIIDMIEANLGTGLNNNGYAHTSTSHDVLWNVENIVTGAGNDTITASSAANVIDTGAGHDTVVFRSASDANHDTILNFEAGDKIDVKGFMGGPVQLVNGATAAAGQIAVSFENINGENFTVLHGQDANHNSFEVDIKGHHQLTVTDFVS